MKKDALIITGIIFTVLAALILFRAFGIGQVSAQSGGTIGTLDTWQATTTQSTSTSPRSSRNIYAPYSTATTSKLYVTGLGGGGTKCVQTSDSGLLSAAADACGTGSGSGGDEAFDVYTIGGGLFVQPTTTIKAYLNDGFISRASSTQTAAFNVGGALNASSTITAGVSGQPVFHWDAPNGRLGLGTVGPLEVLHVVGNMTLSAGGIYRELDASGVVRNMFNLSGSAGSEILTFYAGPTSERIDFMSQSGGVTNVTINNTKVGIGETNPGSLLSVSGGAAIGAGYDTIVAPANGLLVQGNVGIGTTTPYAAISVLSGGTSDNYALGVFDNQPFGAQGKASSTLFAITNGGRVGIGSSSPFAIFSVHATSTATTTVAIATISGQTANALDVFDTTGLRSFSITPTGGLIARASSTFTDSLNVSGILQASSTLLVGGTGTSTFAGNLANTSTGTSTFAGGIQTAGLSSSNGLTITGGALSLGSESFTDLTGTGLDNTGGVLTPNCVAITGSAALCDGSDDGAGGGGDEAFDVYTIGGGLFVQPTTTITAYLNNGFISRASSTAISILNIGGAIYASSTLTVSGTGTSTFSGNLANTSTGTSTFAGGIKTTGLHVTTNGLNVTGSTALGAVISGTWNGTAIAVAYGGTGAATLTDN